jgi:hypothetical protein
MPCLRSVPPVLRPVLKLTFKSSNASVAQLRAFTMWT